MAGKKKAVVKSTDKKRIGAEITKWFAELDRLNTGTFMPEGRNRPILRSKSRDAEKKKFFRLADQLSTVSAPGKRKRIKTALARIAFGE